MKKIITIAVVAAVAILLVAMPADADRGKFKPCTPHELKWKKCRPTSITSSTIHYNKTTTTEAETTTTEAETTTTEAETTTTEADTTTTTEQTTTTVADTTTTTVADTTTTTVADTTTTTETSTTTTVPDTTTTTEPPVTTTIPSDEPPPGDELPNTGPGISLMFLAMGGLILLAGGSWLVHRER